MNNQLPRILFYTLAISALLVPKFAQAQNDLAVMRDAYIEFISVPTADRPLNGLARVYPAGKKPLGRCDDCSRDFKFTNKVSIVNGDGKQSIAVSSFSALENQVGTVFITRGGKIIEMEFEDVIQAPLNLNGLNILK